MPLPRFSLRQTLYTFVYIFAAIGFVFVAMFFAIRFHWTNVSGKIDERSSVFEMQAAEAKVLGESVDASETDQGGSVDTQESADRLNEKQRIEKENACALEALRDISPSDADRIEKIRQDFYSEVLAFKMLLAAKNAVSDTEAFDRAVQSCLRADQGGRKTVQGADMSKRSVFAWSNDEEWASLREAVVKDADVVNKVSEKVGIEPRLVVASMVVEQMRLFHSQRELFKKFFEPLKILGNSTIISLGVMGMKPPTAEAVEQHLKDTASPYYLGKEYEHMLDFPPGVDPDKERYNRLTDENDRHYAYLYGALYLKQILKQWYDAGQDIRYRPEILGTLFNVGFPQSRPNDHPQVGGSTIRVGDHDYSFGRLSYEFYYSGQLADEFPYEVK